MPAKKRSEQRLIVFYLCYYYYFLLSILLHFLFTHNLSVKKEQQKRHKGSLYT